MFEAIKVSPMFLLKSDKNTCKINRFSGPDPIATCPAASGLPTKQHNSGVAVSIREAGDRKQRNLDCDWT